ncbi:MAG: hypothetical protein WCO26_14775 [Deltaproteobacteria bacterium]
MNVKDLATRDEKEAIREIKLDSEAHYQIEDKIMFSSTADFYTLIETEIRWHAKLMKLDFENAKEAYISWAMENHPADYDKVKMVQPKFFGDNRDYFKYDLITSIFQANLLERYVFIPMLTYHRNDKAGKKAPKYDGIKSLELYEFIKGCQDRSLKSWKTWIVPYVTSYQTVEPVDQTYFLDGSRAEYWGQFRPFMNTGKTLVFVDPDIGLQPERLPAIGEGKRGKYILNDELKTLFGWLNPESILMIYQHLQWNAHKHICDTQKKLDQARSVCNTKLACAYREYDLAFLFVAKSKEIFTQLQDLLDKYFLDNRNAKNPLTHSLHW